MNEMEQAVQEAVVRGATSGAEGAVSRAFSVMDENFWLLFWLMLLGSLASTCVLGVTRKLLDTSKTFNEVAGYTSAFVWAAGIEVVAMQKMLGVTSHSALWAVALTAGAFASVAHRPVYRVALLLYLMGLRLLGKQAEKIGMTQEEISEALGETQTKLGFKRPPG